VNVLSKFVRPNTPKRRIVAAIKSPSNETSQGKPASPERSPQGTLIQANESEQMPPTIYDDLEPEFIKGSHGRRSSILTSGDSLSNHIIVYGCENNIEMFISELRRPAVRGRTYHSILIVSERLPATWDRIVERYNDIHFLKGHLTRKAVFISLNIKEAYALILLAGKDEITEVLILFTITI
jgi:hypothetical protein